MFWSWCFCFFFGTLFGHWCVCVCVCSDFDCTVALTGPDSLSGQFACIFRCVSLHFSNEVLARWRVLRVYDILPFIRLRISFQLHGTTNFNWIIFYWSRSLSWLYIHIACSPHHTMWRTAATGQRQRSIYDVELIEQDKWAKNNTFVVGAVVVVKSWMFCVLNIKISCVVQLVSGVFSLRQEKIGLVSSMTMNKVVGRVQCYYNAIN